MKYQVGVIAGDGIGPEVVAEAQKVLNCVADKFGHEFEYEDILMGGCSIDATGEPLTDHAIEQALHSDAVLMGSIGGNTSTSPWYKLPPEKRPEAGLLKLRKSLNLFANLRPAYLYEELKEACPLRDDIIGTGFVDYRISEMMPGTLGMVFKSIFLLLAFFLISVTIYSFALTARYENTIGATLKNALLLTVAKLPYTILMTALTVGAVVLSWWNTGILMLTIPVWILAGTGILAFINSCILRRVFRVFDEKAEGGDEEERTDMEE